MLVAAEGLTLVTCVMATVVVVEGEATRREVGKIQSPWTVESFNWPAGFSDGAKICCRCQAWACSGH